MGETGETYTQRVACCMKDTDGGRCGRRGIKCHLTEADSFILPTVDWTMLVAKLAVCFTAA